jgi:hypothetical protein
VNGLQTAKGLVTRTLNEIYDEEDLLNPEQGMVYNCGPDKKFRILLKIFIFVDESQSSTDNWQDFFFLAV